jgi:hypothetical protein
LDGCEKSLSPGVGRQIERGLGRGSLAAASNVKRARTEPAASFESDFARGDLKSFHPVLSMSRTKKLRAWARIISSGVRQIGRKMAGDFCAGKLNSVKTKPKRGIV